MPRDQGVKQVMSCEVGLELPYLQVVWWPCSLGANCRSNSWCGRSLALWPNALVT